MSNDDNTPFDETEAVAGSEVQKKAANDEVEDDESFSNSQDSLDVMRTNTPLFDTLQQFSKRQYEVFSSVTDAITKFYINTEPLVTKFRKLMISDSFTNSMKAIQNSYSAVTSAFQSPAFKWLQSFDFSPIYEFLRECADIDVNKIKEIYLQELYDAHWFPHAGWNAKLSVTKDILEVIQHTRKSKNRVKKIDKIVFGYYTDSTVETIKKEWRQLGIPEHLMRILHQAVQAYHRKEYAITVIVLATQWEGIIYNKVYDSGRKKTEQTKKHLMTLIKENNYSEIFQSYFEDFIMYNCNSPAEVIKDVPGRNSAAHSFYDSYPTRKAALNAILFTDFLLHLQPITEEKEHG